MIPPQRIASAESRIPSYRSTAPRIDANNSGGSKQKGIIHYGVSANRQNPTAGMANDALFNTFRRTKGQIFYWLTPMIAAYYLMSWATDRYDCSDAMQDKS